MHTFRFMGKKRLKCSQRHILPVSGISGWREQMAAGQRRDIQERRSWTGETQRPKKGNNQRHGDSESIRRRASPTQCSPRERDRERERANPSEPVAVVREQLTSPTGRFYSPLLCVWDPPGWRGAEADWYWQGLCGRGRRAAGGWRRVKKVVMNQQLSLTKARHKNRVRPRQKHTHTHTHTFVHPNAAALTPLNLMCVWSRGEGWGKGCSRRRGAYPKSGPIKHLKIKSHCSYRGAIQRRYLCR